MAQQLILSGETLYGPLILSGVTSGAVTFIAATGTYTLTMPSGAGSAGQFLQTDGSGITTWASAPLIVANADLVSQTAAVSSVVAYTPGSIGTFEICGYINISAILTDVVQFQVGWTDENSNSRTIIFAPTGTTSVGLSSTGFYSFAVTPIRVKASTAITIATVLTTSIGTISYDVGGTIKRIA